MWRLKVLEMWLDIVGCVVSVQDIAQSHVGLARHEHPSQILDPISPILGRMRGSKLGLGYLWTTVQHPKLGIWFRSATVIITRNFAD
jgi:hypothetical protein